MKENVENEHVTNLDYLVELSKGNNQFVRDMVKIFLEENPEEINMLEKGVVEKDFELIKASAHKLRSTVPFVGIDSIIEPDISELEKLATDKVEAAKVETVLEKPENKKVEILTADKKIITRMEKLFKKIKDTCAKACVELSVYNMA